MGRKHGVSLTPCHLIVRAQPDNDRVGHNGNETVDMGTQIAGNRNKQFCRSSHRIMADLAGNCLTGSPDHRPPMEHDYSTGCKGIFE